MVGSDLISALGGKIVPFDLNGVALWLRPLTLSDLMAYKAVKDDQARGVASLIAGSVVDEAGAPALSIEQAAGLPATVADKLSRRIAELNQFGDIEGKAP